MDPDFTLQRLYFLPSGVFAQMSDGLCTGEHAYQDEAGNWKPKIPAGLGRWTKYASPKHGEVFRLMEVDGKDLSAHMFEIHPGNWPQKESEGCALIGTSIGATLDGGKMICKSDAAFESFMNALKDKNEIWIEITD